ncbi:hypothetical protein D917_06057, partial [Trichinella nativa]
MTLRGHLVSEACRTHCPSVFHPIDQQLTTTVRVLHWNRTPEVATVVGQQPTVARISFAYRESSRAELKGTVANLNSIFCSANQISTRLDQKAKCWPYGGNCFLFVAFYRRQFKLQSQPHLSVSIYLIY